MLAVTTPGLGRVTRSQLEAAVDRFGLGRLLTAEAATSGNFGQNVFLGTDRGQYVLRGNPYVEGQLAREQYFARIFHDRCAVPAPWPYLYEPSTDLFGWPFAIMGRVDGEQIADPDHWAALSHAERLELATSLGRAARLISAVEVDQQGQWDPVAGAVRPSRPDWPGWVRATVLDQVEGSVGISADDRRWLTRLLDAAAESLRAPFRPVLVHGDYSRHNATAERTHGGWRIAGVYDLASSHYGHPETELTRQFADFHDHCPDAAPVFLEAGLGGMSTFDPQRFRALITLERIGIWAWAKRTGRGWWSADLGFRDWLEGYFHALPG